VALNPVPGFFNSAKNVVKSARRLDDPFDAVESPDLKLPVVTGNKAATTARAPIGSPESILPAGAAAAAVGTLGLAPEEAEAGMTDMAFRTLRRASNAGAKARTLAGERGLERGTRNLADRTVLRADEKLGLRTSVEGTSVTLRQAEE